MFVPSGVVAGTVMVIGDTDGMVACALGTPRNTASAAAVRTVVRIRNMVTPSYWIPLPAHARRSACPQGAGVLRKLTHACQLTTSLPSRGVPAEDVAGD